MGRTKSRPRPLKKSKKFLGLAGSRQVYEKTNIYKLCVSKLARIDDPQAKLCKAVLINNTLKKLEKQPETYFNSEETSELESETSSDFTHESGETSFEALCSHLLQNLGDKKDLCEQVVPEQDVDTMSLCEDIINEFLGPADDQCDQLSSVSVDNADKEDLKDDQEERRESPAVSQYSYSSFLSEVYSQTLRKIKYRVELWFTMFWYVNLQKIYFIY